MRSVRMCLIGLIFAAVPTPAAAQDAPVGSQVELERYIRVLSDHFGIPVSEVTILAEGQRSPDELPVALRLARLSGVSPVPLLARRRSGESWSAITRRYNLGAASFHVAIPEGEGDPSVARVRELFGSTPSSAWNALELRDDEFVTLANLLVLQAQLGVSIADVLAARSASGSFYAGVGSLSAPR